MRSNKSVMPCPVCHQDAPLHFRAKDLNWRISDDEFDYYRCPRCGLIFLRPVPSDLGRYYPEGYYTIPRTLGRLDRIAEGQRYQIEMVQRFVPSGKLLEIGPGFGIFAHLAKKSGFEVETIELDARCCRYLRDVVGVGAIESDDPAGVLAGMEPQQAIAMWHVVEHLPDPWACLRRAAEKLTPGGILLVAAPNPQALQFRLLRSRWPHVDAPRHVQLIPAGLIARELAGAGMVLVAITTSDLGGRRWNRFGWQRSLMYFSTRWSMHLAARGVGRVIAAGAGVIEGHGMRGSAYTMVLQKGGSDEVLGAAADA